MWSKQLLLFGQNTLASAYGLIFMVAAVVFFRMYKEKLFDYYVKKGLALLGAMFLISWAALAVQIGFSVSLTYAKDVILGFLLRTVHPDLWIIYSLFGFFLVAPFLKKMTEGLSQKEKKWLLGVLVGYFAFFTGGVLLNYKIMLYGYPFLNWTAYALSGYLVLTIDWTCAQVRGIYIAGIAAFIVSTVEALCFPGVNWSLDTICLSRIGICLAIFLWVGKRRWKHV